MVRRRQNSWRTGLALLYCFVLLPTKSALTQDQPVTDEDETDGRAVAVEDFESLRGPIPPTAPVEFFPIPPETEFKHHLVGGGDSNVTAGMDERLNYSNTLGTFGASMGAGNLVSDDITTIVPGGCPLRRFTFPVIGKVNPAGIGGPYSINFALYSSCPGSVPVASIPTLIIPGTQGQVSFTDQCLIAMDDDGDATVNDGCPAVGPAEGGVQCLNAVDDDGDGRVNDGCPAIGPAETDADIPRMITFAPAGNAPLPTNFWIGVKFSRNNAGVIFGTPPMVGFSCDQYDYPGIPCTAWAGGFPNQPHASFNLEIYADSACADSFTGYKNDNPSGPTFNPGQGVVFVDDIQLVTSPPPNPPPSSSCNMIAYEVAVRGEASYSFDLRTSCNGGVIAGTERTCSIFGTTETRICRFTFDTPIPVPNSFFLSAKISAASGGVVVAGQQACIGQTADSFQIAAQTGCNTVVYPDPATGLPRQYAGFSVAITCAGPAPVGACCDMFITDENGDSVCRQVTEVNCPFPLRFSSLLPRWVPGAPCEPDPFSPHPCGVAQCCEPFIGCANLTLNECNALLPLDSPRLWRRGRYCYPTITNCPSYYCIGRTGDCTLPRCRCPCGESCLFPPPCTEGPACCDSCPPVGCDDADCCTAVCVRDPYCCVTEWDQTCADEARQSCGFPHPNDGCAPNGRMEGARWMTTFPPGNEAMSDSGRATESPTDPGFGCNLNVPCAKGLQTVWYKFVATHSTARLETCESSAPATDSLLAVFAVGDPLTPQTQCNTLIPVGCSDDVAGCSPSGKNSRLCMRNLIPGNLYYVLLASKVALAPGTAFHLKTSGPCDSPFEGSLNNYCPGATPISDGLAAFQFSNPMESLTCPKADCAPTMTVDKWYKYTATCTGLLTVDTCGSTPGVGPDTNLAIYEGDVCPTTFGVPAPVACSSDFGDNCGLSGLGSKVVIYAVQGNKYKIRLADSAGNQPSGHIRVECAQADCPVSVVTWVDPPDGVVDARRSHDPSNPSQPEGIRIITANLTSGAKPECFSLCETNSYKSANSIINVKETIPGTYTITLARPITANAKTTITYSDLYAEQSTLRLASHPANVNADEFPTAEDLTYLVAALQGTAMLPFGRYSGDINHSGTITAADVLELVDQLDDYWKITPNPIDDPECP